MPECSANLASAFVAAQRLMSIPSAELRKLG
jgi:hypothetical protein